MEIKVHGEPVEEKKEDKEYGKYDKYEIESCADTLIKAEEIRADKEKMKYVQMYLNKKKKAINSIADLRERYKEMDSEH